MDNINLFKQQLQLDIDNIIQGLEDFDTLITDKMFNTGRKYYVLNEYDLKNLSTCLTARNSFLWDLLDKSWFETFLDENYGLKIYNGRYEIEENLSTRLTARNKFGFCYVVMMNSVKIEDLKLY